MSPDQSRVQLIDLTTWPADRIAAMVDRNRPELEARRAERHARRATSAA